MKTKFFTLTLGFALFFGINLLSQNAQAQELYFFVVNHTGETLNNIYVTPAEEDNWGKDILPSSLFYNNTEVKVTIPATYGTTCSFDLKITDLEGNAVEFTGIDACKLLRITLNADGTYTTEDE